ncbi:VOC family protein [Streptomyces sp. NPDC002144]
MPNVQEVAAYYDEFGLREVSSPGDARRRFATLDGGEQLAIVGSPQRRLLELALRADDEDDLARIGSQLTALNVAYKREGASLLTEEPNSGLTVRVQITPRLVQAPAAVAPTNGPGRPDRPNGRAAAVTRTTRIRPRRLGHLMVGSLDQEASHLFFTKGLGFKVTDHIVGLASFLRCSSDHHNVLVQQSPVSYLHHTAWEVNDVDEVGRGAADMLRGNPERHIWGMGRHFIGSNFFWYLRDPAGNYSEYFSDIDCILEDQLWKPEVVADATREYGWAEPVPPSFLKPDDLADLMMGNHSPKR